MVRLRSNSDEMSHVMYYRQYYRQLCSLPCCWRHGYGGIEAELRLMGMQGWMGVAKTMVAWLMWRCLKESDEMRCD